MYQQVNSTAGPVELASKPLGELPPDSRFFLAPVAGAGWLAGIWLASQTPLGLVAWLGLALTALLGAVVWWRRGRVGLLVAGLAAVALGGARLVLASTPQGPGYIHYYNGARAVAVVGEVVEEPRLSDTRMQFQIRVREVEYNGQDRRVEGLMLVDSGRFAPVRYGSTVRLEGDISSPLTESSSYGQYLTRNHLHSMMRFPQLEVIDQSGGSPFKRRLIQIRERGRQVIGIALPEPHASLLKGILLGDSSGMPSGLNNAFRTTGMTHIIAISGFNIALIIALLSQLATPVMPPRPASIAIVVLVASYALLVGAEASVVRAAIMGIAYLISLRLFGRPTLAIAGLFVAAALMTLIDPMTLWDIGFQLSFMATLGLMIYAGRWTRQLGGRTSGIASPQVRSRLTSLVAEITVVTLAAQLLTLPLILFHFGRLSLASLPANMLLLPAQPAVMMSGGLTLLLGLLSPALAQIAGLVAWPFLHYTIRVVYLLAEPAGASVPLRLSVTGLLAVYLCIALVTLYTMAEPEKRQRAWNLLLTSRLTLTAAVSGVLAIILFVSWLVDRPDGRLHVAFLDVGQGDAIFIQSPSGRQLLIDGGQFPSVILEELGRQMPFWDRSIDVVLATHPHSDHVAGLVSVLDQFRVSQLVTSGADEDADASFDALMSAASQSGVPAGIAMAGEIIVLDEGVQLEILQAGPVFPDGKLNDRSIVARLTYGELSVLLPGDAEAAAEAGLLRGGQTLDSVILKAGHHGGNTSSGEAFLHVVSPQVIVISSGKDNDYGHPDPEMLARATAAGATILRTDQLGTIEVESDGISMWWQAENGLANDFAP